VFKFAQVRFSGRILLSALCAAHRRVPSR
jgi:hypothetical protein